LKCVKNVKYNYFPFQNHLEAARHGCHNARGNSLESPSISLCSEGNISKSQTQESSGFAEIFGKVEKVVNVEECLI
jgi:hypothetical protein